MRPLEIEYWTGVRRCQKHLLCSLCFLWPFLCYSVWIVSLLLRLHFYSQGLVFYYFLIHCYKISRCFLLFFVFCILFVDRLHAPAIQFNHRRFGIVRQQFTNSTHEELDKQRKAVCLTFFIYKGVAPGSTTPFFKPLLAYNDSLIPLSFAYNRKTLGHRGSYDS